MQWGQKRGSFKLVFTWFSSLKPRPCAGSSVCNRIGTDTVCTGLLCFAVTRIFVNRAALIKKYRVHYEILVWPLELDLTKKRISLGSCIEEVGNTSIWYLISIWYQLIWYGKLITKEAETQSWWILNSSDNQRWGGKGQFWLSSPWGVPSLLGVVCREAEVL